jgi:hypothetical protein
VARCRVERRRNGGGGPGGRYNARSVEAGAGQRHVSRGGGGWRAWVWADRREERAGPGPRETV